MTILGAHEYGYSYQSVDSDGYLIPVRRLASVVGRFGVIDLLHNSPVSDDWNWYATFGRFTLAFISR